MSRRLRLIVIGVVVLLVVFVGAPWVYINVIREPAAESFLDEITATTVSETNSTGGDSPATTLAPELSDPSGTWNVTSESLVGYRVDEVLFGQNVTAIGRTSAVTGSVTINESSVTDASFSVDMTTIQSDDPRRDGQFQGRIMDVINYPVATFRLDSPIDISSSSLTSSTPHLANGTLTLRGTSKSVDVNLMSTVRGSSIAIVGEILIVFAEWGIPNPSLPGISTEDSGILEFSLVLER
jgi:polyisoprenoid-binding protein YceI